MIVVHGRGEIVPIRVKTKDAVWTRPSFIGNFRILQQILNQIVQEWTDIADTRQATFGKLPDDPDCVRQHAAAVEDLKPRFIRALFSYLVFFCMVEDGYRKLQTDLNKLNAETNLCVKHDSLPTPCETIRDARAIRNRSVAHWADPGQGDLRKLAGRTWLFTSGPKEDGTYRVADLEFQNAILSHLDGSERSDGLSLPPLGELHRICADYLNECSRACKEYLAAIREQMPVTVDGVEYSDPSTIPGTFYNETSNEQS